MKRMLFLCALMAGAAFAAQSDLGDLGNGSGSTIIPGHFPGTDDVITSQPFAFENLQNGVAFSTSNNWMMADDITPAGDAQITDIEIWDCYAGPQMTELKVEIRADGGSQPTGAAIYSFSTTAITHTTTGLYAWGSYELFDVVATIDAASAYTPTPGTKVWFCLQATSSSAAYWLCTFQTWGDMSYFSGDNGATWSSSQAEWGYAYEQYMILEGESALTADTWAGIKSSF